MDRPRHPQVFRSWKVERLKQNVQNKPLRSRREKQPGKPKSGK